MINIHETLANAGGSVMKTVGGAIADASSVEHRREVAMGDDYELDAVDPTQNPAYRLGCALELRGIRLQNATWYKYRSRTAQRRKQ